MSVWRAGQLRNGHGGGGILCLALPALHTGSSGAQGPWSEFKTKPQPAVPVRGYGPAGPLRGQGACLLEGGRSADWGFYLCQPRGGARDLAKPSFENRTASKLELSAPYTGPTRSTAQPKPVRTCVQTGSFYTRPSSETDRNRERSRSTRARPQIFSHPPNPVVCLFSTASRRACA